MAAPGLIRIPGYQSSGYMATNYSSMNKRALGKFTDANRISNMVNEYPADYDKKIITLYTQTSMYSDDFLQMINKTTPYYIDKATEYWKWKVSVPYQFATLIEIPDSTMALAPNIGINGQSFELVFDKQEFYMNDVITPYKMYGQQYIVLEDPDDNGRGFRYKLALMTPSPMTTPVDMEWLQEGRDFQFLYNLTGEFDQQFGGLGQLGDEITLYQKLSGANALEHRVTDWADARFSNGQGLGKDQYGNQLDMVVYGKMQRNAQGEHFKVKAWEPFIEAEMRKKMLEMKSNKLIWAQPGSVHTRGMAGKQELKTSSMGVYPQIRAYGNTVPYNEGQFSINIIRNVFGDLFYRRKAIKDRRVHLFTNEAGMEVFKTAAKDDLLKAGLTILADDRFIQGKGQHMVINWAFDSFVTADTGNVTISHLMELDLPQTNSEFGRNKKSIPVFLVFDVSKGESSGFGGNVREVRMKSRPSMTWGYIDGTASHLGFPGSQGMQSANKFPGYEIWMKDRYDVFIEDPTRCVLIEQVPQF